MICFRETKDVKEANAAGLYTPILLKLLNILQMCKKHKEGNFININLTQFDTFVTIGQALIIL